jgi:CheY-like chemotaxis protein
MNVNILLIEDNQDIRENTAELLELEGYRVTTADNGLEGIRLAERYIPDLIISDVLMPGADGYTVFQALLNQEATRHIPFLFITAKSESADKAKALSIGRCAYLVKPFDEKELLDCLAEMLRQSI